MDREIIGTFDELAALTASVREPIVRGLQTDCCVAELADWRGRIGQQLPQAADDDWLAESLSQTLVCGEWAARQATFAVAGPRPHAPQQRDSSREQDLLEYLRRRLSLLLPAGRCDLLTEIGQRIRQVDFDPLMSHVLQITQGDPVIHGYEHFLAAYDPRGRARSGVYYTPRSVVRFLIRSVDEVLQRDLDLPLGLADTTTWRALQESQAGIGATNKRWSDDAFVRVLDPACGTGAFLVELIEHLYRQQTARWQAEDCEADVVARRWRSYVDRQVLPCLIGFEVMMAPWAIAHIRLAAALAGTGRWLEPEQQLRVYLTDTLADPTKNELFQEAAAGELPSGPSRLAAARYREPVTVILGNPPYAGISDNQDRWIRNLLRGRGESAAGRRSYYQVDGRPLRERKLWLTDDYVKFLRYAQWRIDRAGCGVVGLVTNHGFLDNTTFRGMRHSLMQTFSDICVVDLHGNVKKREQATDGTSDESVFATEQGMATSVMSRKPAAHKAGQACRVSRGDLWGTAGQKRERLRLGTTSQLAENHLLPQPPHYLFVACDHTYRREYERGYRLPEIMPEGTTAAVTARDRLVVALSETELIERIGFLRDPSIAEDEIRARFFAKSRSPKYAPGDTRGWKLAEARHRLQHDANWRERVATCLYRPFDCRKIYWTDAMIDWPRTHVMRHLMAGNNLGLIARRQMLPQHECNFFWVTDRITIDGVIRSDNRGSESVFPLFLLDAAEPASETRTNFSAAFVRAAGEVLPARPIEPQGENAGGPVRWLGYIYAQFFAPTYRQRFAEFLRIDFPRIFLTADTGLWDELARLGCQLMGLHLGPGRRLAADGELDPWGDHASDVELVGAGPAQVAAGYPKFVDGEVAIGPQVRFAGVPREVWEYCVGGHQVCRKWLKDRRGRTLAAHHVAHYAYIVGAVDRTRKIVNQIELAIEKRGGWQAAF